MGIAYSDDFIKDAISRELARGGQVYFLHNQVRDIEEMAHRVQHLIPDARVSFAHGQMSERELEKIMMDFIQGEIDMAGIPSAETLLTFSYTSGRNTYSGTVSAGDLVAGSATLNLK